MSWLDRGWQVFPPEPGLEAWLAAARPAARAAARDPAHRAQWLRHGATWFAGVDVLANDPAGRVGQGPPLACAARAAAEAITGPLDLHRGQVSVTFPGYPGRDPGESDAGHRFRLHRDAAHLDGLLPIGPDRRRMIREPHGYVLGLPLDPVQPGRAPLVVWEGSHEVLRAALRAALAPHPAASWPEIDVTAPYQAARREVFDRCRRVEISAAPGAAILMHRLSLHGIAPWPQDAGGPPHMPAPPTKAQPDAPGPDHATQGAIPQIGADPNPSRPSQPDARAERAILYFRPVLPGGIADWLTLP